MTHEEYQAWRAADQNERPEEYETSLDRLLREVAKPYRDALARCAPSRHEREPKEAYMMKSTEERPVMGCTLSFSEEGWTVRYKVATVPDLMFQLAEYSSPDVPPSELCAAVKRCLERYGLRTRMTFEGDSFDSDLVVTIYYPSMGDRYQFWLTTGAHCTEDQRLAWEESNHSLLGVRVAEPIDDEE